VKTTKAAVLIAAASNATFEKMALLTDFITQSTNLAAELAAAA